MPFSHIIKVVVLVAVLAPKQRLEDKFHESIALSPFVFAADDCW